MDVAGWITAAGTAATPVGMLFVYFVVRPLKTRMADQKNTMAEQTAMLDKISAAQDARVGTVRAEQAVVTSELNRRLTAHELSDAEAFDDHSEKLDAKIAGLRREMVEAHDRAVSEIRNDIRALSARVDSRVDALINSVQQLARGLRPMPGDD